MIGTLKTLFERDLIHLGKEISLYENESNIWLKDNQVNNSAGTLCLHLCGNLQHFIGSVLGNTGYVRDRKSEFSNQISRDEILLEIELTRKTVAETLTQLDVNTLKDDYPIEVFGHKMTKEYFLIHLHGHLTYHLGQLTYHRRLLDH